MTRILFERNGIVSLGAVSKEEDLTQPGRISINAPPGDGRCDVCGRHISELKPFGGPGDPLVGNFTGEILIKRWRPCGPYDEEAERANEEAEKEFKEGSEGKDVLQWYITKYGKEKGEGLYYKWSAWDCKAANWECRDCMILDEDEYFEKLRQRYQEYGNE